MPLVRPVLLEQLGRLAWALQVPPEPRQPQSARPARRELLALQVGRVVQGQQARQALRGCKVRRVLLVQAWRALRGQQGPRELQAARERLGPWVARVPQALRVPPAQSESQEPPGLLAAAVLVLLALLALRGVLDQQASQERLDRQAQLAVSAQREAQELRARLEALESRVRLA